VKFAIEVLSLLAFLLGSPVYLPRLVDTTTASNPVPVKTDSAAHTAIPRAK
jgi:hypothetical protein